MGIATGFTAARMLIMEAATIVSGEILGNDLILEKHDGTTVNAGNVRGPKGDDGMAGTPLDSYPIGAVYTSTVSTHPSVLFGGTWVKYAEGRMIIGIDTSQIEFDTVNETGGSKTKTISESNMPSHNHSMAHDHSMVMTYNLAGTQSGTGANRLTGVVYGDGADIDRYGTTGASSNANTGSKGSDSPMNILNPFVVSYMWTRTA